MQATNETVPKSLRGRLGRLPPGIVILAFCLPAPVHFFESFPNGWDQAEYVWCVKVSI